MQWKLQHRVSNWNGITTALSFCLWAIIAISAAKALFDLFSILSLEWRGPVNDDFLSYTIVGRGILNGLIPYKDLFMPRPPGIFILSAVSLFLTGGERFATIMAIVMLLAIPISFLFSVKSFQPKQEIAWKKWLRYSMALLLGIALVIHLEERAGALQTEMFGAFFSVLLILSVATFRNVQRRLIYLLNGVLFLCAVGFKEPFLMTATMATLMVAETNRQWLRMIVLPAIISLVFGVVILFVLGWFSPYINLGLPATLHSRIIDTGVPIWLRGFAVRKLFANATDFSTIPFLGYTLAMLFLLYPFFRSRTPSRWLALRAVCAMGSILAIFQSICVLASFILVLRQMRVNDYMRDRFFLLVCGGYGLLVLIAFLLIFLCVRKQGSLLRRDIVVASLSLYFAALAVGLSGNYNWYHFTFAFPVYVALIVVFLRSMYNDTSHTLIASVLSSFVVIGMLHFVPSLDFLQRIEPMRQYSFANHQNIVSRFDAILDACGVKRYISLGAQSALAYAKHSPYGPSFILDSDRLFAVESDKHLQEDAQIIALPSGQGIQHPLKSWIEENFTSDAPACAKTMPQPFGIRLLFRKT
ncbi:MAG: hypothetical protein Q7S29_04225 [Candidatus Peribacter sp.]|nr:hypothetical protein [Candidatus Peribacter sp.]